MIRPWKSIPKHSDRLKAGGHDARRVAMVVFPSVQLLDVVGPLEVLAGAGAREVDQGRGPGYAIEIVGPSPGLVRASSGLAIAVDRTWDDRPESLDTLIVAGGIGSRAAAREPRVLDYVRAAAPRARRVCSVCTGAAILAAAGLLDGRRATTHWAYAATLAEQYPRIDVDPDSIYLRDGPIWTSAGVTAGMDLALALVEDDVDRALALEVSRWMVMFMKRPGGQSQFSAQLAGQMADRDPLRDLQAWIVEHPELDHSIEALARRAAMSPRHFARVFRDEVGAVAGALRRMRAGRGGAPPARGIAPFRRGDRGARRLRNGRDDATGLPAPDRRGARGLSRAIHRNRRRARGLTRITNPDRARTG